MTGNMNHTTQEHLSVLVTVVTLFKFYELKAEVWNACMQKPNVMRNHLWYSWLVQAEISDPEQNLSQSRLAVLRKSPWQQTLKKSDPFMVPKTQGFCKLSCNLSV